MKTFLTKAVLGATLSATALTAAIPADAQSYRRSRGNDNTGVAIIAGIAGLAIGAAIASSNNNDRSRYDRRRERERQRELRRQGYNGYNGGYGYNGSYNNGYDNGGNYYVDPRRGQYDNRGSDYYRGYGDDGYRR